MLVIVTTLGSISRLYPLAVGIPFLIASSLGNRFASSALHVEVDPEDGSLTFDGKPVEDIRDVWLADDVEPRVVVAHGEARSLAVLWFENRTQAKRFADAFTDEQRKEIVAGYRPRKVDLLSPLRFVAIALAFFAVQSWYGGLALVFVPLALRNFWKAKQLVVHGETFELATAFDSETFRRDGITKVELDDGVITMKERELHFSITSARDAHLATPSWSEALRRRALRRLATPPPKPGSSGSSSSSEPVGSSSSSS